MGLIKQREGCLTRAGEGSSEGVRGATGSSSRLGGVRRAGACCIMKTIPAHSQLRRSQDSRNERPMNGLLCATITAALGQEGNGQRSGRAAPSAQGESGCTEKLPRNARIPAKDKESQSHSMEPYPFSPPLKKYRNPIKRPRLRAGSWKELVEVLCASLSAGVELTG